MSNHRPCQPTSRRRGRRVVGVAVAATLVLTACGDDDSASTEVVGERDEFGVALMSAGEGDAEERITLPAPYEVGQRTTTTADLTLGIEFDGGGFSEEVVVGMTLVMTQEVTDVAADVATVEGRIDDVQLTEAPAGVDPAEFEAGFDAIAGEVVVTRYSQTGMRVGDIELASGGPIPDEMVELFEQSNTVALPSDPVSVGARWSSLDDVEFEGIVVEGETIYELVELTDDRYVLELTQDIPLDERIDGADLRGSYEAEGTITGHRQNPLDIAMDYEQIGRFAVTDGSERANVTSRVVMQMRSD